MRKEYPKKGRWYVVFDSYWSPDIPDEYKNLPTGPGSINFSLTDDDISAEKMVAAYKESGMDHPERYWCYADEINWPYWPPKKEEDEQ